MTLLVRWLLAAVVFASPLARPTLCHAHPGGDRPHHHDPSHENHHPHEHFSHRDTPCLDAFIWHQHWSFLTIDWSLPTPVEQPVDPPGDHLQPAGATLACPAPLAAMPDVAMPLFLDAAVPAPGRMILATSSEVTDRERSFPPLLCDRARRERSGVQLS